MTPRLQRPNAPSLSGQLAPSSDFPQDNLVISLSTEFYPGAHTTLENLVFASQDSVYFYVHSLVFSGAAEHAFRPILSAPLSDPLYRTNIIHVPETSEVLNIMFHTIYNTSCLKHSPLFDTVVAAIDRMPVYELNPKYYITPSTPLHEMLLHFKLRHPLEVYAIAAHYDVYDITEATSAHLLSYPINTISDELATRMGAIYLKRLLALHANRLSALKLAVMLPPSFHPLTQTCTYNDQGKLSRAWVLAAAYLAWEAQPSLSVNSLEAAFRPLQERLTCAECRQVLSTRVKDAVQEWSHVKFRVRIIENEVLPDGQKRGNFLHSIVAVIAVIASGYTEHY